MQPQYQQHQQQQYSPLPHQPSQQQAPIVFQQSSGGNGQGSSGGDDGGFNSVMNTMKDQYTTTNHRYSGGNAGHSAEQRPLSISSSPTVPAANFKTLQPTLPPRQKDYADSHDIVALADFVSRQLILHRPSDPLDAIPRFIETEYGKPIVLQPGEETIEEAQARMKIELFHAMNDPATKQATQAYIQANRIGMLLEGWLDEILQTKPENPVKFSTSYFRTLIGSGNGEGPLPRLPGRGEPSPFREGSVASSHYNYHSGGSSIAGETTLTAGAAGDSAAASSPKQDRSVSQQALNGSVVSEMAPSSAFQQVRFAASEAGGTEVAGGGGDMPAGGVPIRIRSSQDRIQDYLGKLGLQGPQSSLGAMLTDHSRAKMLVGEETQDNTNPSADDGPAPAGGQEGAMEPNRGSAYYSPSASQSQQRVAGSPSPLGVVGAAPNSSSSATVPNMLPLSAPSSPSHFSQSSPSPVQHRGGGGSQAAVAQYTQPFSTLPSPRRVSFVQQQPTTAVSQPSPDSKRRDSPPSLLIVYHSIYGHCLDLAKALAERLIIQRQEADINHHYSRPSAAAVVPKIRQAPDSWSDAHRKKIHSTVAGPNSSSSRSASPQSIGDSWYSPSAAATPAGRNDPLAPSNIAAAVTLDDFEEADGIILAFPVKFGTPPAPILQLLDQLETEDQMRMREEEELRELHRSAGISSNLSRSSQRWRPLVRGKPFGVALSTATQHGGQENCGRFMLGIALRLGAIFIGSPPPTATTSHHPVPNGNDSATTYGGNNGSSTSAVGSKSSSSHGGVKEEVQGGTPFGPTTIAGERNERTLSTKERILTHEYSLRFAEILARLVMQ